MNFRIGRWAAAAILLGIGGCSSYRMNHVPHDVEQELVPFLEKGKTPRNEIQDILGRPSFESARDRVIAYRVSPNGAGSLAAVAPAGKFGWSLSQYNLVLAFDGEGILQDYTLIQMKEKIQ